MELRGRRGGLLSISLEAPRQLVGSKPAPLVPAGGVPAGRGAGGSGAYVHTQATSSERSPQVFEGTTLEGEERQRRRERNHTIHEVYNALYQAGEDDSELRDHGKRLWGCNLWMKRIDFPCGTHRVVPCPCNSIFCSDCSRRRSKPIIERIEKQIDPYKRYWFLTITVKNSTALTREGLSDLADEFSELRESNEWKKHVTGGVYSIEATFNRERGDWHPHLHVLIETKKRLPRSWIYRLRVLWRRLTGSHVLHLQVLYGRNEKGQKTRRIDRGTLCELVKYATKANDFSNQGERVVEFYRAFRNLRRMQSFGSFFGLTGREPGSDEESEIEGDALVGCACGHHRWSDGTPNAELIHITRTFLDASGIRQLRLFDSGTDPPKIVSDAAPEVPAVNLNLDLFFHQHELSL